MTTIAYFEIHTFRKSKCYTSFHMLLLELTLGETRRAVDGVFANRKFYGITEKWKVGGDNEFFMTTQLSDAI